MLEVNNFNAVRITLASPEQIRSWSRGEVVKPETINYRTLKPERDGLFCERIFGPTKDWECSCGKYKRVRYKGIICDKCGVEVTRAKVRRERMGHIELASPVSHIWFVKGTPSRIGLLLDITPRVLEQVLYFAKYIITEVHETGRSRLIQQIEHETEAKIAREERAVDDQIEELTRELSERIEEQETGKGSALESVEAQRQGLVNEVPAAAQALEARIGESMKKKIDEDLLFEPSGKVIVEKGSTVAAHHRKELTEEARDYFGRRELELNDEAEQLSAPFDAEIERLKAEVQAKAAEVKQAAEFNPQALREAAAERVKKIESIKPRQTLNEAEYRELLDQCGRIFKASMGAEAVRDLLRSINMDELASELRGETRSSSGQRRKKATKRLRVVEAFRKSGNRPEWMVLTMLPVLPPDLRPMVQLDGGRFATSDLNDLYRRVINRNNRLKRLLELGAPEIIIRNEKRMLQEAVDSLIDNGRRGRAVSGSSNHKLKSLSDMLKGKQGRFRQNLLGKRVDYSGRSVIVVGPTLKLHQCGLPRRMALELFKPFVMRKLVERNHAHNIKSAKRLVERVRPEVWDVLEEVILDHPVLLNRAPTLHRLGIQAFEPVLIEGSAIQIHPLVCAAFNADFDGDQMAVHVPLSAAAKREARDQMLSLNNLLLPSNGEPIVAPTLDMVLGCYYLTMMKPSSRGEGKVFGDPSEARLAYDLGLVDLRAAIKVRVEDPDGTPEILDTSVGRVIFNESINACLRAAGELPMPFRNDIMDKAALKSVVGHLIRNYPAGVTAHALDEIKRIGFEFATRSGLTIAVSDIRQPETKKDILDRADSDVARVEREYRRGLITDDERYGDIIQIWTKAKDDITNEVGVALDPYGSVHMMSQSGAKGNLQQISQMAGMRGLMADPSGRIIELPIRSSFRDGLSVLEYFLSTHGARKGLADTAIRTADSGYLTRRLIDVSQNVIIYEEDCETEGGLTVEELDDPAKRQQRLVQLIGRLAVAPVVDEQTGEVLVDRDEAFDEESIARLAAASVKSVVYRSPLTCEARHGICQRCYGWHMGGRSLAKIGDAVGIVAAQSIGEPGTQLTMRTFHTGGVAGIDITSGLPRVEELFEARVPKGEAVLGEIDGVVEINREEDQRTIKIVSRETYRDELEVRPGYQTLVTTGDYVDVNQAVAEAADNGQPPVLARLAGMVELVDGRVVVTAEERDERTYVVPPSARIRVEAGQPVAAGDQLTEGSRNPQAILQIQGREAVQRYLVDQVQDVYRSQGVNINDKHIEIIVRQMLRKLQVDTPGDTDLLPGELVDRFEYEDTNRQVLAEGGEPATAKPVLLGVTKASLNTESFLAAASFQETTKVLTEAALAGKVDKLLGLKENVIIGKLIPAGSGLQARLDARRERLEAAQMASRLLGDPEMEGSEGLAGPVSFLTDEPGMEPALVGGDEPGMELPLVDGDGAKQASSVEEVDDDESAPV
jgi:DNA-directed RNA polymerase subunit beta'